MTTGLNRRRFLQGAMSAAALASSRPALAAEDLKPLEAEIARRHDENVQRLQNWIRQPAIAAENRGMNEGCELMMRMVREAGFDQVTKVATAGHPGVFATLDAGAPRTVGIYFMYDVKQADPAEWTSPPFEARLVDKPGVGKVLVGRGAVNQRGPEAMWLAALGECSLGSVLVAATELGICAILFGDEPGALVRDLEDRFPQARLVGGDRGFEATVARVIGFVEAPALGLDLPLDVRGTAFQRRVWETLRGIPAGETVSYAQIAERIGAPKAVRAVAQACRANALAVAVPCHRVVRSDGALSGYRWGVERKRQLLDRERRA